MYTENDLVRIAKRENNTKRSYLVVNPLQGKHVPVEPSKALDLFGELGGMIAQSYSQERILLIGFAETATAIGAAIAGQLGSSYMQTTREMIEEVEYFYFSESHSHATEQKLVKNDLDSIIDQVDRIIFIEDEVTTGNTILNIIRLLQAQYGDRTAFAVASLLNGMDEQAVGRYQEQNINLHYLVKTDHSVYEKRAELVVEDGQYLDMRGSIQSGDQQGGRNYPDNRKYRDSSKDLDRLEFKDLVSNMEITCNDYQNARRLVKGMEYQQACDHLWRQIESRIKEQIASSDIQRILVVGTEEFMYPALYAAGQLESAGKQVLFHATTRSPIAVSKDAAYPLHQRFCLPSVYEEERTTFLYNIGNYDLVLLVTDASKSHSPGVESLMQALHLAGNSLIDLVRWC